MLHTASAARERRERCAGASGWRLACGAVLSAGGGGGAARSLGLSERGAGPWYGPRGEGVGCGVKGWAAVGSEPRGEGEKGSWAWHGLGRFGLGWVSCWAAGVRTGRGEKCWPG